MTRLLVVNPNISTSVSELIEAEARRTARPETEIRMRTAASGVAYIETPLEALLAGGATAEILARDGGDVDAAVIAAFGDPGMPALKELLDIPIVGITEAALSTASLLGRRLAIVAISNRIAAWYGECVTYYGYSSRVAAIRSLQSPLQGIDSVQQDFRSDLVQLAYQVVDTEGADAVILAGAPLAGLAREVVGEIPVPVVDGIAAGVAQAELLVQLGTRAARAGSYTAPPVKENRGLSAEVSACLTDRPR